MGGTDTGATVLDRLVRDGELPEIVTNHLGLDLNLVEGLAVVDADVGTNQLRHNNHVAKMRLDDLGLVLGGDASSAGLLDTLDQGHRLVLQAAENLATRAGGQKLQEALAVHLQKLLELNTAVGELAERSLLLEINVVGLEGKIRCCSAADGMDERLAGR